MDRSASVLSHIVDQDSGAEESSSLQFSPNCMLSGSCCLPAAEGADAATEDPGLSSGINRRTCANAGNQSHRLFFVVLCIQGNA